jgi:ferric-dicitrate binding protein FerR (iron transport regulator)
MRIAAHSCRTAMKSFAGARATVTAAAVNGSAAAATEDVSSEASDAAERWLPLEPRHREPWSPEELLQSFHFRPFPRPPPLTEGNCSLP